MDSVKDFVVRYNELARQEIISTFSKGDLMKMAYGETYRNVDSALPMGMLEEEGISKDEYWHYVMDYNNNGAFGHLTDLFDVIAKNNPTIEVYNDMYELTDTLPILDAVKKYENQDILWQIKRSDKSSKYAKGSTVKGEYNGIDLYDNVYIPSLNKSGMVTNIFTENGKRMVGIELLNGKGIKIEATKVEKKLAKGSTVKGNYVPKGYKGQLYDVFAIKNGKWEKLNDEVGGLTKKHAENMVNAINQGNGENFTKGYSEGFMDKEGVRSFQKYAKGSTVKGGVVTYTIWRMDDNGQRKVYQKIPTEKEAKEIKAKEQLKYPKEIFRIQKFKGEFSAEPLDWVEDKYAKGGDKLKETLEFLSLKFDEGGGFVENELIEIIENALNNKGGVKYRKALELIMLDLENNGEILNSDEERVSVINEALGKYAKGSTVKGEGLTDDELITMIENNLDERYEDEEDYFIRAYDLGFRREKSTKLWFQTKEYAKGGALEGWGGTSESSQDGDLIGGTNAELTSNQYGNGGGVGEDLNEVISTQMSKYNKELRQYKQYIYRGYWFDETHEGFLAIDEQGERISDWKFEGEEFSEENLKKMFELYPNAKQIIFSTRLNGRSDENENESGVALDHSIMEFDVPKKYAKGSTVKGEYGNGGMTSGWCYSIGGL